MIKFTNDELKWIKKEFNDFLNADKDRVDTTEDYKDQVEFKFLLFCSLRKVEYFFEISHSFCKYLICFFIS